MFWDTLQIILYILSGITVIIGFYGFFKRGADSIITKASFILSILFFMISYVLPQGTDLNSEYKKESDTKIEIEKKQDDKALDMEQIRTNIITDAEEAFNTSGYEAAIEIISNGLSEYPNDEVLCSELEKYKSFQPASITTYDQLKNTTDSEVNESTYINEYNQDKFGNVYSTSFALSSGSVSFVNNQSYSLFKGVVACPYGIEYDSYRESAKIYVYTDDNVLVWSSNSMRVDSKPQPFEIDITGSDTVTLTWECEGANVWQNWGFYATIFDGEFLK